MPGFFVSNKKVDIELKNMFPERCRKEEITSSDFTAKRNTLNKFLNDKTLSDSDGYFVALEGILLNKTDLFNEYKVDDVTSLSVKMYLEKGDEFFADFRGGFTGAFYDKKNNKWLIFTNHAGDIPVFYAIDKTSFYAGTQVNYVIDACKNRGLTLTFDEDAAYQMLTYAFMIDDATYAKEIRRLRGGTYLYCKNDELCVKTYHTYSKNPGRFSGYTQQQIIDEIDEAFRRAVSYEYDKDLEYGYCHLSDISGGLDARMSMWVAHELNYTPIQLMTYSHSGYLDEIVSKQMAEYWKAELLVKPLDDAQFLYDIDEIVFLNAGLSIYSGITGGNRMLRSLNYEKYGIEHDGIFGGAVLSSWYKKPEDAQLKLPTGRYSEKLSKRIEHITKKQSEHFGDHELFLWYTRAFHGMANTHMIRRNYFEPSAAFMDVEFAQLCMDIPFEFRMHHGIHKNWIIEKYPKAAEFKWTKIESKITERPLVIKLRKLFKRGPQRILRMIGLSEKATSSMTPFAYWISKDEKLRNFRNDYAENAFKELPVELSSQLLSDMKNLLASGTINEKSMVLTVLGATKLYFGDQHK